MAMEAEAREDCSKKNLSVIAGMQQKYFALQIFLAETVVQWRLHQTIAN